MQTSLLGNVVSGVIAAVGIVLLIVWCSTGTDARLKAPVPGLDETRPVDPDQVALPPEPGDPVSGEGTPADIAGQWPWFRGPQLDGICHDGVRLARRWPPEGPPVLWTVDMGEGHAGPVISDGCVYVLDYDVIAEADTMRCLSLADGREIWRNGYPVEVSRNHGRSRTVSAVAGDCVISLGPRCHVACWDKRTGVCRWLVDLVVEYGAVTPEWYAGQCPLVDGDRVILAPASKTTLMMAVSVKTGKPLWQTANPRGWGVTHSSILPMDFAGRRMYVYCTTRGVVGVSADDGTILWDSEDWKMHVAFAPAPLVLDEGRIFLSAGYNKTGSLILKLAERKGGRLAAETALRLTPKQFNSEQHTPVLYKDHVFGLRKRGGGQLVCLDLAGKELWNSGRDKFGLGPYMIADGLIFVMSDVGTLAMAEATTTGYHRLGQAQVFEDGSDAWGPMAMVDGKLIVRDLTRMTCLDVARKE